MCYIFIQMIKLLPRTISHVDFVHTKDSSCTQHSVKGHYIRLVLFHWWLFREQFHSRTVDLLNITAESIDTVCASILDAMIFKINVRLCSRRRLIRVGSTTGQIWTICCMQRLVPCKYSLVGSFMTVVWCIQLTLKNMLLIFSFILFVHRKTRYRVSL